MSASAAVAYKAPPTTADLKADLRRLGMSPGRIREVVAGAKAAVRMEKAGRISRAKAVAICRGLVRL